MIKVLIMMVQGIIWEILSTFKHGRCFDTFEKWEIALFASLKIGGRWEIVDELGRWYGSLT